MHNQSNNCPICGRCFCGVTKVYAINGKAVCTICKPNYEKNLVSTPVVQPNLKS
jgi:hypothetical protein